MKPYYEYGGIAIYHGDCREMLPLPCSAVVTDPPFAALTHANAKTNRGGNGVRAIAFDSMDANEVRDLLRLLGQCSEGWVVSSLDWRHAFDMDAHPPDGLRVMRIGVWVKPNPMPQISADRPAQGWEAIAYLHREDRKPAWNGGGSHGNFWLPVQQSESHPTQKPLSMLLTIVERFTGAGDLILDPFMGSGTTLRAAKDLGRRAIGIEIEERYCEIAAKRLAQETLFAEPVTRTIASTGQQYTMRTNEDGSFSYEYLPEKPDGAA